LNNDDKDRKTYRQQQMQQAHSHGYVYVYVLFSFMPESISDVILLVNYQENPAEMPDFFILY
jgi:hypothetical protein